MEFVHDSRCPVAADDQLGPRVDMACRQFDFTLLFEDGFLVVAPAALLLLLLPWRLRTLSKAPVKVASYRLATWKLGLIAALLVFHLLFLVFRVQTPGLYTRLSVPSGVLDATATVAAGFQSFMEDQRSVKPSDMLVVYFTLSTILYIPRLRSLWLIASGPVAVPRAMWTIVFIGTASLVFLESARKTRFLRPTYKSATAEQTVGFWSRSFFIWVLPFFQTGFTRIIQLDDIPKVDQDLEEESAWTKLDESWRKVQGRHRLLRATFVANLPQFLSAITPRLALSAFTLCQPFLIEVSVSYMNTKQDAGADDNKYFGQALVGAFVLAYTGIAVSRAVYWRQTYRMMTRTRSGLIAQIYRHTTTLPASAIKDSAAITLMGTDVERIVQSLRLIHELWASIPEVAIAVWLLARQLGAASVVPLIICIASVAATSPIASKFGPAQREWVERVEKRVAVTASMLGDMKAVKMLGLSSVLKPIILRLREIELKTSEKFRTLFIWQIMVGNTPTTLAPFATFTAYAIIALVRKDDSLLSAQAFASLSLINLVTNPLLFLCQALPNCTQAAACFGRIEKYLLRKPAHPSPASPLSRSVDSFQGSMPLMDMRQPAAASSSSLMTFEGADIVWSPETSEAVLRDLTLTIHPHFTAVVGPVASGKSTLLATMVGETALKQGSMTHSLSGVAYCPQNPWIMNDTIRHNITGGLAFDQKWYDFSIYSCGLQADIERMPRGDYTNVGSNGASLSGGQRQRVALARAVYSRLPIVILDDMMSGLDPATAGIIITRLFSKDGHFRKAGISVVLATHSRRILPHMDMIAILDGGRLADYGSFEEIQSRSAALVELAESSFKVDDISPDVQNELEDKSKSTELDHSWTLEEEPSHQVDQARQSGSWSVYAYYSRSAGAFSMFLWASGTLLGAVATNITPIWIEKWTRSNEDGSGQGLGFYLGIYALLVALATIGPAVECWSFFIRIINNTALKLHYDLLESTLRAPFSFFQKTDTGTITNRFSQDMDLIDMTLPLQAISFTTGAASCLVQLIIICVLGKYLAASIPVLAVTLFLVQRYYLRTSRQVRLIDIEAKAPLYKHFIETAQGVASIRAFRWGSAFHDRHRDMLNRSQRPFYILLCVQQWLSLVLDLTVGALAVVLVAVATSTTDSLSAGTLGVALVLTLEFNSLLGQTIQAWTKLETSIGAVARVQQFVQETPSEASGEAASLPSDWPPRGDLRFQNVVARYTSDAPPALANFSLNIAPREKIAICGSSGSGKTSLIMAVLRMIEMSEGQITIDNMDVSTIEADSVRSRLNVVPQDPYFMPGTVRFNLDPQERSSDDVMESAIRKVGLWERIGTSGGLDMELVTSEWSHGERQLLCLARALLVPSTILILDEATSSVDGQTEAIMQAVIDAEFRHATVISVLHRFTFIDRFDRVAVMRQGELVECDSPEALLGPDREESAFRELYRAHHS
ncbi:P-loop containing nucleoside triphosphate hydrolase protein [Apodospora peruviana]|uniref:P-loop containing nucleoside triphosphate hydrolase protein n=1 Tax=Apodospora peruviana TaxID=516989 RepID=A0AAE0MEN2_9PEZI|nr:P-loop containing nucleoside triphosphate hydrolase protein [Apodospora peruviana]